MELSDWFKGFEKGIAKLSEEQRETFFRECGRNSVQCGTLQIYKDLYEQAAELLSAYNPMTGNLWLLVLATTLLSPVMAGRISMRR